MLTCRVQQEASDEAIVVKKSRLKRMERMAWVIRSELFFKQYRSDNESLTFLSYSFKPKIIADKFGKAKSVLLFRAAICDAMKTSIRKAIKEVLPTQWSAQRLEWFAEKLNPKIYAG